MAIEPENELDYQAFCISLYTLLQPAMSMDVGEFVRLPEAEAAYKSGKTPEQLAMDTIKLTKWKFEQAKKIIHKKRKRRK